MNSAEPGILIGFLIECVLAFGFPVFISIALAWLLLLILLFFSRIKSLDLSGKLDFRNGPWAAREAWMIHGTFAQDAEWCDYDQQLSRQLLDKGYKTRRFDWSGRNSIIARQDAASSLASDLKQYFGAKPDGKLVLIGHSHGGTVVINAISEIINEEEKGILKSEFVHRIQRGTYSFCLASPILLNVPQVSSLWRRFEDLIIAISLQTFLISVFFAGTNVLDAVGSVDDIGSILTAGINSPQAWPTISSSFQAVFFAGVFASFLFIYFLRKKYLQPVIVRSLINPDLSGWYIKYMNRIGDEAHSVLAGFFMVAKASNVLSTSLFEVLNSVQPQLKKKFKKIAKTLFISGLLSWLVGLIIIYFTEFMSVALVLSLISGFLFIFSYLVLFMVPISSGGPFKALWLALLVLIFPFLVILRALSSLAFGVELALAGIWHLATVDKTPPGTWEVSLFKEKESSKYAHRFTLSHSLVYSDSRILRSILSRVP